LTLAAEATGDGCLGLHLSLDVHLRQVGVLGYVLLNSSTLGDALRHLQRYLRVLTEGWEIDLEIDGGEAVLVARMVDPLVKDERQIAEGCMSSLLNTCELITGAKISPIRVEFRHRPKEARTIERRFGCPVRYGQDRIALFLKRKLLHHAVEAADDELLKILKRHCRQIIGTRPRTKGLAFEVRELITTLLPNGQPMIDDVARELGMSSRTLRRRLADQGLIYKELVEDVRHKLALRYMSDKRINLKQVVYLLGYSDLAAFNHAFRRWTGSSPSQYRRKGQ
jgi:AraC-like DNA-binding protein